MIGDRLFTDVLCGNRMGLYTVLVRPVRDDGKPCRHADNMLLCNPLHDPSLWKLILHLLQNTRAEI